MMDDTGNLTEEGSQWRDGFIGGVKEAVQIQEQKKAAGIFSYMKRHKKAIITALIVISVVSGVLIVVLPNFFVQNISLVVDESSVRSVVYDPIYGNKLTVKVNDNVGYSIISNVKAPVIFSKCDYDARIIGMSFGKITAKSIGKTDVVCESSFNGGIKTTPITIEVYE